MLDKITHRRPALAALTILVGVALAVLAAAAPVAQADDASFDKRKAENALKDAVKSRDLEKIDAVGDELHALSGEDAQTAMMIVIKLASKIPPGEDRLYWRLIRVAALFHNPAALEELGDFVIKQKKSPFTRDLVFALQDNVNRSAIPLLARILDKAPFDLQLLAVDRIAGIKSVESVDALIAAYQKEKKPNDLTRRIDRALRGVTGADMGNATDWAKWWEVERANGLSGAEERHSGGTGTVTDDLDPTRHTELEELKKLTDKILVLKAGECLYGGEACNFDHVERMLEQMQVEHKVETKEDFNKGIVTLDGIVAVIINCTQMNDHCICKTCKPGGGKNNRLMQCTGCDKHELYSHRLTDKSVQALADFARRGGFIFSEDWALVEFQAKAFPKQVQVGKSLKDQVVDTYPARGATSHPYMRGVFRQPAPPAPEPGDGGDDTTRVDPPAAGFEGTENAREYEWKVDDESPSIRVVDKKGVTTLLVSKKLRDQTKDSKGNPLGDESVAITFVPQGTGGRGGRVTTGAGSKAGAGGRVLHVMSHFGKQNDSDDEFVLQNLLLNFLLEASSKIKPK